MAAICKGSGRKQSYSRGKHPPWPYQSRHFSRRDHAGCIIPSSPLQCRPHCSVCSLGLLVGSLALHLWPPQALPLYPTVSSSSCQLPATPHSATVNILFCIYRVSKRTILDPQKHEHLLPWMYISFSAAPTRPGFLILATRALPFAPLTVPSLGGERWLSFKVPDRTLFYLVISVDSWKTPCLRILSILGAHFLLNVLW